MSWLWNFALSGLTTVLKPVFDFLNNRVDAKSRMHISDNDTMAKVAASGDTAIGQVGTAALTGLSQADMLNAQLRAKEGSWAPMIITSIVGFLVPFGWHTWQVVLDSSRWIPVLDWGLSDWWLPYISLTVELHAVGSWKVAALPGMFETTEHAVINSLFIGASTAVVAVSTVRAIRR